MDRRRLLMNVFSFPDNYLFKEGKGLKDGLDYLFSEFNGSGGSVSSEYIYINGGNEAYGGIILGDNVRWVKGSYPNENYYVFSDGLDLSEYKTLKVEMTCYSNSTRQHGICVLNESRLNTNSPAGINKEEIAKDAYGWDSFSKSETFYDTTQTRQIYSFDISEFEKETILIRSGDYTSLYAKIHNIWLE